MKNLKSIAEHSDWLFEQHFRIDEKWDLHRLRVAFGKQPLELWQFVPCDEDGNVLELPKVCICADLCLFCKKYQKAKERCLFNGFENYINQKNTVVLDNLIFKLEKYKTIEDLVKYNLQLTPTAIKQLGL